MCVNFFIVLLINVDNIFTQKYIAMSRRNFHSPVQPVLSNVRSQGNLQKSMLSGLFSRQFLGCLKDELSSKTKLNKMKSRDEELRMVVTQVETYRKEMQAMRRRIEQLTEMNLALSRKLKFYTQNERLSMNDSKGSEPQPIVNIFPPKILKKIEITPTITITLKQQLRQTLQNDRQDEVSRLKQRIQNLQLHKSVKQQRLNELLQKEVRLDSEIKLLKLKNVELEDEVLNLRETVVMNATQKALKETVNSERRPDIAVSYSNFDLQSPRERRELPPQKTSMLFPVAEGQNKEGNMLYASFTNNVAIPEQLTLSKACQRKENKDETSQFNEIDYIISEELPYLNISDELQRSTLKQRKPVQNLNESVVLINMNA